MRLAAYISTVFTMPGRKMEVGIGREMEELGFNVFFDNFSSGRTWKQLGRRYVTGGHKYVDNFGEGVTMRKLTW